MIRVALDSNVLAYLAGVERHPDDPAKVVQVRALVRKLLDSVTLVAPVQALGELFSVLQKGGRSKLVAREVVLQTLTGFETPSSGIETFRIAVDLATDHKLQLWDALILSASAEAGCALLLSEDMQPGFTALGVTIVDPFAPVQDRRLTRLLS